MVDSTLSTGASRNEGRFGVRKAGPIVVALGFRRLDHVVCRKQNLEIFFRSIAMSNGMLWMRAGVGQILDAEVHLVGFG